MWTVGSFGHDLETEAVQDRSPGRQTRGDLRHVKASLCDRHHQPEGTIVVEFDGPSVQVEEDRRREPGEAPVTVD